MAALDLAALEGRALAHRQDTLRKLWWTQHDKSGVSAELLGLNRSAPPRLGLHLSMNEAGAWFASTPDDGLTRGKGFVPLIAFLARVDEATAATFLSRIIPAGASA